MNHFFTADTHFGHANIIRYVNRPFNNVNLHDKTLIDNWNMVVEPGDRVYHLGDFGFGPPFSLINILKQLNGEKFLIKGNHDRLNKSITDCFAFVKDYYELKIDDEEMDLRQTIVMSHYPIYMLNRSKGLASLSVKHTILASP